MSLDPLTYVDGVPVKIVEKFRPPRKITLPATCNYQVNTEVLTEGYEFIIENSVLQWLEDRKKRRIEILNERKSVILKYDEDKAIKKEEERILKEKCDQEIAEKKRLEEEERRKEAEQEMVKQLEEEEERKERLLNEVGKSDINLNDIESNCEIGNNEDLEVVPLTDISETQNGVDEAPNDEKIEYPGCTLPGDMNIGTTNDVVVSSQSTDYNDEIQNEYAAMLTPTQFLPKLTQSPVKKNTIINFADFESDANDPFDSTALKSINDMEELAKVLQSSNVVQKPTHNAIPNSVHGPPPPQTQGAYPNNSAYNFGAFNHQYPNYSINSPANAYSNPYAGGVEMQPPSTCKTSCETVQTTQSGYPASNFAAPYYQQWNSTAPNQNNAHIPPYSMYSYPVNSNISVHQPTTIAQHNPLHYSSSPKNDTTTVSSFASHYANISTVTSAISPPSAQSVGKVEPFALGIHDTHRQHSNILPNVIPLSTSPAISKRPDLEDFYLKYYACKKPTAAKSGESTPAVGQQSNNSKLRSFSSVPDLTENEDKEVDTIVSSRTAPHGLPSDHVPSPLRPASTGRLENITYTTQSNSSQASSPSPRHVSVKSRLPDPFAELTSDTQEIVQNMTEMGFPRARVARAVLKLGIDHKKVR